MEMLKDPEIAREVDETDIIFHFVRSNFNQYADQVQAMMNDPAFKAEMKRYTESPAYKQAMNRASEDIEVQRRWILCAVL